MRYGAWCAAILVCASVWRHTAAAEGLQQVDWTLYHKKEAVFQAVEDIIGSQQSPQALTVTSESGRDGNYSTTLTVVTVEPGGLAGDDAKKIRLLLNFGQHGREVVVVEVGLQLLQLLADDGKLTTFCEWHGIPAAPLLAALKHTVFKVVPMENPRGRDRVEAGESCLRKNGRGVDTNRNWAVHWGVKEPDYDPEEEYPGTAPFSEPEAAMMKSLAQSFKPHVWVNVHSGMEAMFLPYDHRAEIPVGDGPKAALGILKELNVASCGGRCAVGSGGKSVGYLAHGTATDYMFQELHVPLPFTWEIYGDFNANFSECYPMFNPTTRPAMEEVVENWTAAFLRLVLLLPRHPAVAEASPAMSATIQDAVGSVAGGPAQDVEQPKQPIQGGLNGKNGSVVAKASEVADPTEGNAEVAVKHAAPKQPPAVVEPLHAATGQLLSASEPVPTARAQQSQLTSHDSGKTSQTGEMPGFRSFDLRYLVALAGVAIYLCLRKRRNRGQSTRGSGGQGLPRKRLATAV